MSATFDLTPFAGYEYGLGGLDERVVIRLLTDRFLLSIVTTRRGSRESVMRRYVFSICGVVDEVPTPGLQNNTRCYGLPWEMRSL